MSAFSDFGVPGLILCRPIDAYAQKSPCQEKNRKFLICIQSLIGIRIRYREAASILRLESMVGSHDSSFCYFQRGISSSIKTVPGIVDLPFEFVPAFQMPVPANHYFKPAALFYT